MAPMSPTALERERPASDIPGAPEPSPRPGRPTRRWFWPAASLSAIALAAAAFIAVHLYLNGPASLGALRAKAQRTLQGSLGDQPVSIGPELSVGWLGRVRMGPLEVGAQAGRPAVLRVERVVISPRWTALLVGRIEPGVILLDGVQIEAGREGEDLSSLLGSRRRAARGETVGRELPLLRFRNLVVRVGRRNPVQLGPADGHASVSRSGPERRVFLQVNLPSGGFGEAVVAWGEGAPRLRARLEGLQPQDLPRRVREAIPVELLGGSLSASLTSQSANGIEAGSARFEVALQDLTVRGEELAAEPVGPIRAGAAGLLRWNRRARSVSVEDGELWLGRDRRQAVAAQFAGDARLRPEPEFAFRLDARQIAYRRLLEALPPVIVPDRAWLEGDLTARLSVSGPVRRPAEWRFDGELDTSELTASEGPSGVSFLKETFDYQPPEPEARGRSIAVGPENPRFVPMRQLPSWVTHAVTISEDAGFYGHRGFDFAELRNAVAERFTDGRIRGASTITQQLAKNLFLSRERTLARKAREALLTVALESTLSKTRLLEIYLNIAEWGPGIYGIGEAARHYFGKNARDLGPKEAAFLATIIPNPVRYHVYYTRGELSAHWQDRVRDLLVKMRAVGQLSDPEFEDALGAPLVFNRG
jgi:hypothetical protein